MLYSRASLPFPLPPRGLGQAKTAWEQSTPDCIRTLQFYLANKGQLDYMSATGVTNKQTERALARIFGEDWKDFSGGACAMFAQMEIAKSSPVVAQQMSQELWLPGGSLVPDFLTEPDPSNLFGVKPATLALIGGGVLVGMMLLMRK